MIRTFYFAGLNRHRPEGFAAVSVSRITPAWFPGPSLPFLAPPIGLVRAAKSGRTGHAQYEEIFRTNVLDRLPGRERLLEIFHDIGPSLLLCCYEKPGDFCHRHLLAARFREMGIDCEEFNPSPQLSLFGGMT